MTKINRIEARIITGDITDAGTDGTVYLGICGREFKLDSSEEDFDRKSDATYVLGQALEGERIVLDRAHNDPREDYPLDSENLEKFPAYIRFDQDPSTSAWNLDAVSVTIKSSVEGDTLARYNAPINIGDGNLWLGKAFGSFCYLLKA